MLSVIIVFIMIIFIIIMINIIVTILAGQNQTFALLSLNLFRNSYTMVCPPVRGDCPRVDFLQDRLTVTCLMVGTNHINDINKRNKQHKGGNK